MATESGGKGADGSQMDRLPSIALHHPSVSGAEADLREFMSAAVKRFRLSFSVVLAM